MDVRSLIPWGRNRNTPALRYTEEASPFLALHREMNRLFDDFFRGFDLPVPSRFGGAAGWPNVEVSESEKDVKVVAELPGIEEKDVDVTLSDGVLTLRGEKKQESNGALYSERWHGRFERSIQLGAEIDPDKVTALFKNGVLTVTLGKRPEAQSHVRRIPIKG
ncbi:MAG TPA: Hsp20/alpha crystallin family protein [Alphaproteobacteria bacterium]|nr:Hsp20/alpha crystallin family protein [Alphaproteobacteria bacterium]